MNTRKQHSTWRKAANGRNHGLGGLVTGAVILGVMAVGAAKAANIPAGSDLFITPSGTSWDHLTLPADFFGPGSDPFDGQVYFTGNPFPVNNAPPGSVDTIVKRKGVATLPGPGSSATVPTEMVALDLVSAAPITVTFSGGGPVEYDVRVCLSSYVSQTNGSMTIYQDNSQGGHFDSTTPVTARLTFTPSGGGGSSVTMDPAPQLYFTVNDGCWSYSNGGYPLATTLGGTADHDCDSGTPGKNYPPSSAGGFFVGICYAIGYNEVLTTEEELLARHRIYPGGEDPPPPPGREACCLANGSCVDTYPTECAGQAQGPGTNCATTDCPQPPERGACCDDATGVCTDGVLETQCLPPLRFAANTLCVNLNPPCGPQPQLGACCSLDPYDCYESYETECTYTWLGPGTTCAIDCPPPQVCEPQPDGLACKPVTCPDPGEVCLPKKIRHNVPVFFPLAGEDILTGTTGYIVIEELGGGQTTYPIRESPNLTRVIRESPVDMGGYREVAGEIIEMQLMAESGGGGGGGGAIYIRESPTRASAGHTVGAAATSTDYPADSFFDLFVEIDIPDLGVYGLYNDAAIPLEAYGIARVPPLGSTYLTPTGWLGVPLLDSYGEPTDYTIIVVVHELPPAQTEPEYEVIECECTDPTSCHVDYDGIVFCVGGCPTGEQCNMTITIDSNGKEIYECKCEPIPQVCEPEPDGLSCKPVTCPNANEVCLPKRIRHDLPPVFFPPAGEDILTGTTGYIVIEELGGAQTTYPIRESPNLTRVIRESPTDMGDHRELASEIIEMELMAESGGGGTILIRESPTRASGGHTVGAVASSTDYPADSFFDLFVEIDIPDLGVYGLYNDAPIPLEAYGIARVPPLGSTYLTPSGWLGAPLLDSGGGSTDYTIIQVVHELPPAQSEPEYEVIECECTDPAYCHIEMGEPGAPPYCVGGCPEGEMCEQTVTPNPDGTFDIRCDCRPLVQILDWRSMNNHGLPVVELPIYLNAGASGALTTTESREDGITKVEVDFTGDISGSIIGLAVAQDVTLGGGGGGYGASAQYPIGGGSTLVIEFAGGLPDQRCYLIDLTGVVAGLVGDPDCQVRGLFGDTNNDQKTDLTDMALAKFMFISGTPLTPATARHDVNLDGRIDLTDMALIKYLATRQPQHQALCP